MKYSDPMKYGAQDEVWYLIQRPKCSWSWETLCEGAEVIEGDLEWEVGDGTDIDATNDKWVDVSC